MKIDIVGIAGLGLLGRGIAACCLASGLRVVGYTRRQETHESARQFIHEAIGDLVKCGDCSEDLREQWPDQFTATDSLESFRDCDMIIETVVEDMAVKQEIYDLIESIVRPDVPIASNTSALPISDLQRDRRHPERFVGMHWSENAHATRFMELIRGEQTSDEILTTVADLAHRLGKEPSLVRKDVPAFICNRIGYAMYREAVHILEMGVADVETIDRTVRNAFGLWAAMCGPFRWMDISGGPAGYARAVARVLPTLDNSDQLATTMQKMIETDAQGVENGRGFYQYADEDKEKWKELFREHVWHVKEFQDEHLPRSNP